MVDDSSLRERFVAALEEAGLAERRDELLGDAREWVLPGFHVHRDALERMDFEKVQCGLAMLL